MVKTQRKIQHLLQIQDGDQERAQIIHLFQEGKNHDAYVHLEIMKEQYASRPTCLAELILAIAQTISNLDIKNVLFAEAARVLHD